MAVIVPIVTDFDGRGIEAARKSFKKLETAGERAHNNLRRAALPAAAALAGVAAAAFSAVKAAAADVAAQEQLARTLGTTTRATIAQIAASEKWITSTSMAVAVTDDELRPALALLARGTGNLGKAQKGLALALDISAGAGLPLLKVTTALSQAYAGNLRGLVRLDPRMKALIKDGATAEEAIALLGKTFAGDAAAGADTASGKFRRLQVTLEETKEAIGAALLPAVLALLGPLQRMAAWAQDNAGVFLAAATAIGAIAAAITAANLALRVTALAGNPFALTLAAITLVGVGLVTLWKKSESFRMAIEIIGTTLQSVFGKVWKVFEKVLTVIGKIATLVAKVGGAFGAFGGTGKPAAERGRAGLGTQRAQEIGGGGDLVMGAVGRELYRHGLLLRSKISDTFGSAIGTLGSLTGRLAGKGAGDRADAEQAKLDAARSKRHRAELVAALADEDAAARASAQIALEEFDAEERIAAARAESIAATEGAAAAVESLGATFASGATSALHFRAALIDLFAPVGGMTAGPVLSAEIQSALGGVLTPRPVPVAKKKKKAVKKLAEGGIVTAPTLAMIGEGGPEAVVPLGRGGGFGTTINVTVTAGLVSTPDQIGQQIIEAIQRAQRRSGPVFAAA